nr:putative toluene monooxygenase subunit B [uncultured bacterium]
MSKEVARGVTSLRQNRGRALQHFVALPVAVAIVEWLELVEVDVARMERAASCDESVDVLVQQDVSGQERQRIRITCRLHAYLGGGA